MEQSWLYYICIMIGFCAVVILYRRHTRVERFEVTPTSTTTPPPASSTAPPATTLVEMPQKDHLGLYIASFTKPSTYQCQTNHWCDALRPNVQFFMNGDNLPLVLEDGVGLALKTVKLTGPASYLLAKEEQRYVLGSFSVMFYGKLNPLDLANDTIRVSLFEIMAQTPNRIALYLSKDTGDTEKVLVNMYLGPIDTEGSIVTWAVPKTTLYTNANNLLGIVYDADLKKLKLYIGATQLEVPKTLSSDLPLVLSVSEMSINATRNLDLHLVAFAFYQKALLQEEVQRLQTYFEQHATGFSMMVKATEELSAEMQSLLSKVQTSESTVRELQNKLATQECPSDASSSAPRQVVRKWQIKMDGRADVSTQELGQCKALSVDAFGGASKKKEEPTQAKSASLTKYPPSSKERYRVPYPPNVSTDTSSRSVDGATVRNPTKPSTKPSSITATPPSSTPTVPAAPAAPTTSTPAQEDKDEFWTNFFSFMKTQQEKNVQMEATKPKVNLSSTYDALRNEVSTDRTQPGNLNFQPSPVQDPPKATVAEAPAAPQGFWSSIRNIFLA
jgi:hypothetical protein